MKTEEEINDLMAWQLMTIASTQNFHVTDRSDITDDLIRAVSNILIVHRYTKEQAKEYAAAFIVWFKKHDPRPVEGK